MLPYTLRQLVWMLTSALQLIYALSTGIVWVMQMLRLFAYGACVGICFIPHWWWYLTSPNIIRRVSYRSSDTTKKRNILRVLEAEGVDLREVLRKNDASSSTLSPSASQLPTGVRRRRVLVSSGNRSRSGQQRRSEEGGGTLNNSAGRRKFPPPVRRRCPLSDVATVSGALSDPSVCVATSEEFSNHYYPHGSDAGNGDGEAVESALAHTQRRGNFDSAVSYLHGDCSRLPPRPRLVGPSGSSASALQLPDYAADNPPATGVGLEEHGMMDVLVNVQPPDHLYPQQQQHGLVLSGRRAPPSNLALVKGGPRRRSAARPTSDMQLTTTLERLMEAAPVDLNPADGSALRSLPMQQRSPARDGPLTTKTRGRSNEEACIVAARRQRPSHSPHCTTPLTNQHDISTAPTGGCPATATKTASTATMAALEKPEMEAKQSSSSSCDMTANRLELSSGDDDRGLNGHGIGDGRSASASGPASAATPQLRSATPPPVSPADSNNNGGEGKGTHQVPVYEGRPVYYDTLPRVELTNDPLLKDVLAALQEGEDTVAASTEVEEADAEGDYRPFHEGRLGRTRGGEENNNEQPRRTSLCARRRTYEESGLDRPLRRSPQRYTQQHRQRQPSLPARTQKQRLSGSSPELRLPSPLRQRTRTLPEEDVLAGLDEEDEEDRMNLHNRATVDIVLPVPLDSLMKTLEYTQHSKRLRRKRFPIVIDVTGAVWIIGSHLWSTMMARVLAQRGYVVFCPDYRNFPQTTMEGMTLDVSDAVAWVLNNAERYNGDLSNVTLIGQSAGAHLTMMSLLSQAQLSAYRSNTQRGVHQDVPAPSDVAYNVPRYNPRESIHRYVGLSGMYNIEGLVDHFQKEGLNTPVLHQIAGGRDQLARYSIHAYFDDRRNGDTGEVLPDNIFDYFPQRMFFVHGDADKCAPVTESASLVAMLRRAQARYAVRRSERSEEAMRHALRSRRLLPGALTGGLTGSLNREQIEHFGSGESVATHTAFYYMQQHPHHVDSPLPQTNRVVDDYEGDVEAVQANMSNLYRYDYTAHTTPPPSSAAATAGQSILINETGARRSAFYGSSGSTACQQQQQQQQPQATIVSPIVSPCLQDRPMPSVELEFIVIPNGRHSDAFVEECIAAGRSCCVDFLCDYESAVDLTTSSFSNSIPNGGDGDSIYSSMRTPSSSEQRNSRGGEHIPAWMAESTEVCALPDGILPLAVPTEERSLPLRLCTLFCPF